MIEEIENGLYPTQAARVLRLMKEELKHRRIDVSDGEGSRIRGKSVTN